MTNVLPIEIGKTPQQIITMDGALDEVIEKVEATINGFSPNLNTAKGRKEIASLASKIAKTKTAIDGAGKEMTDEWRTKTSAVNAVRKRARDELDRLRDEARKPLTDWEAEQEALEAKRKQTYQDLVNLGCVGFGETSEQIKARISKIEAIEMGAWWGDLEKRANTEKERSIAHLTNLAAQAEQNEKQAAELAEMKRKQEQAEREKREAEAKAQAAKAERERIEREKRAAEERRVQHAKNMIEYINCCADGFIGGQPQAFGILLHELKEKVVIDDTFGDLKTTAEEALNLAIKRLTEQQQIQAKEAEERRKRELAEAEECARVAEQERIEAEKRKQAEFEAMRRKDAEHHAAVVSDAKNALVNATGLSPEQCLEILDLIEADKIPHVSIKF